MATAMDESVSEMIPEYMNLHSSFPTQAAVEKKQLRIVPPTNSIESTGPISFQIPSGSDEQIWPCGIRMELVVQVRDRHGNPIEPVWIEGVAADPHAHIVAVPAHTNPQAKVFPVNGFAHAMFSDIEVWVNETKIASYDGMYPYKSDFQCRLFTNSQNKKHSLKSCGFHSEPKPFDSVSDDEGRTEEVVALNREQDEQILHGSMKEGKVWAQRFIECRGSTSMYYIDRIYSEIFNQEKPLPPNAKLTIKFDRSKPEFCLLSPVDDAQYTIKIEKFNLLVPIIKVDPNFVLEMQHKTYAGDDMHYPLRRIECHSYLHGRHIRNLSRDNILVGGVTPRRIFVCIVSGDARNGSYKHDPFNYQHFNLEEIKCLLGGQLGSVPPIKCDYENPKGHMQALQALLTTLGSEDTNEEVGIDIYNFRDRNNIYAFDINGLSGVELVNAFAKEIKMPTGVDIRLSEPTTETVHVIIYKEYDSEITINKAGEVKFLQYA